MRMKVACLAVLVFAAAVVVAQDTNYCSDGWDLFTVEAPNGETHHLCFLFGQENEQMSHDNAKLICEARGGFLAEVPFGPLLNTWITDKLLEEVGRESSSDVRRPQYGTQYWLGARDFGHHNEHVPGTWMWETRNTTVNWFDWGDGEPNNFNGQNCLTYLLYTDAFGNSRFHWNDWDCTAPADFICEKFID